MLALVLALVPLTAFAAEYVSGAEVRVTTPVGGDLYASGFDVVIDAEVRGDLIVSGVTVEINQPVRGNVYVAATQVVVRAPIDGDLMLTALNANVRANVGGTVRALVYDLRIERGAIGGDLAVRGGFGGSSLTVDNASPIGGELALNVTTATVASDIAAGVRGNVAGELRLGGTVGGPIQVEVGDLRFTEGAVIAQPVTYTSTHEALIDGGTTVTATLNRIAPPAPSLQDRLITTLVWTLFRFIWAAALGAFLLRLMPGIMHGAAEALRRRPLPALGWGGLALLLVPAAAVGLMLVVIGLPVGLVILAGFVLTIYASQLVLAMVIGGVIAPQRWREGEGRRNAWRAMAVGLAIIVLARAIPIPGWYSFSGFMIAIAALGALVVYSLRRHTLNPTPSPTT